MISFTISVCIKLFSIKFINPLSILFNKFSLFADIILIIKLYEILKKLNFNVVTAKKFYISQLDEIDILQKKTNFISSTKRKEIILKAEKNKNNIVVFDDGLQDRSISYV